MSNSIQAVTSTPPVSQIQKTTSPAVSPDNQAAKTASSFGKSPAASLSISSQAKVAQGKVAQAKALAIKNGHDPDGIQDGK